MRAKVDLVRDLGSVGRAMGFGGWIPMLLALSVVAAPPKDRIGGAGRPVEMTARGGLTVDLKRQVGIAKGDVVIRRDDVTVCCDEAEAKYSGNRIEQVTCRGRVVIVRADGTRATADRAVFRAVKDDITLTGKARVVAKDADLEGERIVYEITEDRLVVEGGKSRFRFAPKPGEVQPLPARSCPPSDPSREEPSK